MEVKIVDPNCQNHYVTRSVAKGLPKRKVWAPSCLYPDKTVEATEIDAGRTYQILLKPQANKCPEETWTFDIADVHDHDHDEDDACDEHSNEVYESHKVSIWRDNILLTVEGTEEKMILAGGTHDSVWFSARRGPVGCEKCDTLWLRVTYYGHDVEQEEAVLPLFIKGVSSCGCSECSSETSDGEEMEESTEEEEDEEEEGEYVDRVLVVDEEEPDAKRLKADASEDIAN
jgi:hypothetical protein